MAGAGTPGCCALSAAQPVALKGLDIPRAKHHTVLTNLMVTRMASSAGPFTFAELQTITSLGRGEIRECINRRIISAPAGVGQGNHRSYNKWNLIEGVIAAALLRQVRAGAVEQIMNNLRSMLDFRRIDPDKYCESPSTFDYDVIFPPRSEPDDKSGLPLGEEMAESGYLLGTATQEKHYGPPLTEGTPLAAFCKLPIDLKQAVRFVNHMIETRL